MSAARAPSKSQGFTSAQFTEQGACEFRRPPPIHAPRAGVERQLRDELAATDRLPARGRPTRHSLGRPASFMRAERNSWNLGSASGLVKKSEMFSCVLTYGTLISNASTMSRTK